MEFLFTNGILLILLYFIVQDWSTFLITAVAVFLLNGFFVYTIGKRRLQDIEEIKRTIYNIRKDYYSAPNEIKLNKSLLGLEQEIKNMFDRVRGDIEYLKKLEKMRTGFLANVSHELKTPIFAISGYIETLLNGAIHDDKVNKHFLKKAHEHTNNLSSLLNDLIDISMIESGEMRMSFRYFPVKEHFSGIVEELSPLAEHKSIELILHPVRDNLRLFGDKARIKQVMTNLIQNAIKYTVEGKVEVIVEEEGKYGKVIVRDTGIGIAEEDRERIFERFYRVDKARSREIGGTGLGLAIVKHILDAHNTSILVKSENDKGSEFSFTLKK